LSFIKQLIVDIGSTKLIFISSFVFQQKDFPLQCITTWEIKIIPLSTQLYKYVRATLNRKNC